MNKFLRRSPLLLSAFLMLISPSLLASGDPETDSPVIIEIKDKYNEVSMGLTKKSVYFTFDRTVKDFVNREITETNELLTNQFLDSEGYFMPETMSLLKENKLEYKLKDISDITFYQGKLTFHYANKKDFVFEDILNTDGNIALENFFLEDLERFYLAYRQVTG